MTTTLKSPASNRAVRITLVAVGTFAVLLFVFLGVMLWQNPTKTTLRCTRATNACTLVQIRRDGMHSWPLALNSLINAHIVYPVHSVGLRGAPAGYEVYLHGTHGDDYITIYNTLSGATSMVLSINEFLAHGAQPELVIVHDESTVNTVAWILMLVMPLFVIGMLVFAWHKTASTK
ncbi:MAG: hypothetical protein ACRESI_03435 [Gammaproteobacteria bacterium]